MLITQPENDLEQQTRLSFFLFGMFMVWTLTFHLFAGSVEGAPPDVTDQMEKLGNPLKKSQSKPYARNVTDLHEFKNRIYIGHGDFDGNAGPIDIWYWSRSDSEFVKQGPIPDEEADRFTEINGQLHLPGIDPRGRGSGHFYRLENGEWITHKSLPSSTVHGFDIAGRKNKIVLYTGHDSTVVNRQKKRTRTDPRGLFGATVSDNKITVSRLVRDGCEDLVRNQNTMYTVAYRWKNPDNLSEGVVNTVYKSTDVNNWEKRFIFETPTMVRSMEVHEGTFYFGLGCQYRNLHESSGSILKISNPDKKN